MDLDGQWGQWSALSNTPPTGSPTTPTSDVSDIFLTSPYMFAQDDPALNDVLGQPSPDEYGRFMPCLDFSGPLGPELVGEAEGIAGASSEPYFKQFRGLDDYDPTPLLTGNPRELSSSPRQSSGTQSASRQTQLRTSRKPEPTPKSAKDSTRTAKMNKAPTPSRKSHNQVEKKYRDRLNEQFERLLAALAVSSQEGEGLDEDGLRPLSKSAVLGLARRRLLTLEKENRMLVGEVERLGSLLQRVG